MIAALKFANSCKKNLLFSLCLLSACSLHPMQSEQMKNEENHEFTENEMHFLNQSSLIREACTNLIFKNESVDYHCKRMKEFLWCAKYAATEMESKDANERIKNGDASPEVFEKSVSYAKCHTSDNDWTRAVGDCQFWQPNYHSEHLCKEVGYSPAQTTAEMAHFLETLHNLANEKKAAIAKAAIAREQAKPSAFKSVCAVAKKIVETYFPKDSE